MTRDQIVRAWMLEVVRSVQSSLTDTGDYIVQSVNYCTLYSHLSIIEEWNTSKKPIVAHISY